MRNLLQAFSLTTTDPEETVVKAATSSLRGLRFSVFVSKRLWAIIIGFHTGLLWGVVAYGPFLDVPLSYFFGGGQAFLIEFIGGLV